MRQTPVAPGLPSTLPNSTFCSTFDLGPCFPQFLPPIGQDLRLTIVSTDDDGQRNGFGAADQLWRAVLSPSALSTSVRLPIRSAKQNQPSEASGLLTLRRMGKSLRPRPQRTNQSGQNF
jgi:hypothetical protein